MAMTVVETRYGKVRGIRGNNRGNTVFRGIPYAKAPVGELRFAPPAECEKWEGVRDCTDFAPTCMQMTGTFGLFGREFYPEPKNISEDCLYLNVWTPAEKAGEKRPVFFFIHGGAYLGGYSYEQEFDGEAMNLRGCILVTIEYRCNAFGFFAHPELTKKNGRSGSAGMEDQLMALKWVYENIEAFGGDPENITVHGQSAGAMSTRTLLASPRAKGMVNRVIIQSGGGINDWSSFRSMSEQEQMGEEMLKDLGWSFEDVMTKSAEEVYERLNQASMRFGGPGGLLTFHPCIDDFNLFESPGESIKKGEINTDSIMCGSVAGDFRLNSVVDDDDPEFAAKAKAGGCISQVALGEYNAAHGYKPIYGYFFDRALPGDNEGSWHSCEMWYMFGSLCRCWRPWKAYDYALSDLMVDYWCNFARTGDPNSEEGAPEKRSGETRPLWPAYTEKTPCILVFGDSDGPVEDGIQAKKLIEDPAVSRNIDKYMKSGMAEKLS